MTSSNPKPLQPIRRFKLARAPFEDFGVVVGLDAIFIGDRDRGVRKLDRVSLEAGWTFKGDNLAPGFVRGSVLLIGGNDGWYAADVESGTKLWGPRPCGWCLEWQDQVVALRPLAILNLVDGSTTPLASISEDLLGDTFIVGNTIVGTGLKGDPITACDLVDQRVLWKRSLFAEINKRTNRSDPARLVSAGESGFLIARRDHLAGCSLEDGSILWESPVGVPYYLPNVADGRAYILVAGDSLPARFVCVDVTSGRTLYDVPQPLLQLGERPFRGNFTRDEIAFCTTGGLVIAFKLQDGEASWWHRSRERVLLTVGVDHRVLVPTADGNLLVFEPNV